MIDEPTKLLMCDYLRKSYPILRMRLPYKYNGMVFVGLKGRGNFKRVIKINSTTIFKVSDADERYKAMHFLSTILSRTFYVTVDVTIPIIKKHLHIR